jgi:hypothetical protein
MWLLESAKDQTLGVDTPGKHEPSCVQYGMACLLIRNTIGSMSCSVEWGLAWRFHLGPHGARGAFIRNP